MKEEYDVRIIDINFPGMGDKVSTLLNTTFNLNMPWEIIKANTFYNNSIVSSPPSFYVGAFVDEELVGFVAFKSHDFLFNGEVVNCFHHCFVATASFMRGKKIFPSLLAFGKDYLRQIGNIGFVYGVPNDKSAPVFRKLNYKYFGPFLKVNVINIPSLFDLAFHKWKETDILYIDSGYYQNDYQIIDAKKKANGNELIVFEDLGNLIWGKILYRKVGPVKIPYFSVGGMIINKPHFFKSSVKKLCRIYEVQFIQFIFHNTSIFKKLFSNPKVAPYVEPLMIDELTVKTSEQTIFNFMPGIKDHF